MTRSSHHPTSLLNPVSLDLVLRSSLGWKIMPWWAVSEIANLHTVNADQCRIPLKLRVISFSKNIYETTLPKDSGILIPGYWMLFVMDEAGVPSVSKIMMIGLDKKRTIQPAQDPLGLLEAQSSKHESPLTFQKSW
ncbi:uncharacterized protein N7525_010191 [Penicillium rubens]|uniref:uncharacterized protein n=1 Tax=Penicillium rubens TaxID=1108849 RepID=UPI002A5998D6|nr:uncharacterized protein N7525_010191 [Penicillium rubens]KAJ5820907.1 hypothetical protein N7525_010191 [Penicillium rubens]